MEEQIHIRPMTDRDMSATFEVRVRTWHNDRGREELAALGITSESVIAQLNSTHRGWCCEVGGQVVGFAIGDGETGEMWVIAVLPEFEGKGIGRRLIRQVEGWLFGLGWKEIWLTTDRDETIRAVGFYRHLGWTDWKIEPDGDRFMKRTNDATRDS